MIHGPSRLRDDNHNNPQPVITAQMLSIGGQGKLTPIIAVDSTIVGFAEAPWTISSTNIHHDLQWLPVNYASATNSASSPRKRFIRPYLPTHLN